MKTKDAYALRTNKGMFRGERAKVKVFKTRQAMDDFIVKDENSLNWRHLVQSDIDNGMTASGTYAWAGNRWHNVKTLDPSALAHI